MDSAAPTDGLVNDYLRLGLRFDRIEEGFVDAYTGDPALRREVLDEPAPDPARLAAEARRLRRDIDQSDLPAQRREFIATHLRALECSGRKLAGEAVPFIEEVRDYFDVEIGLGDPEHYRQAHRELDALLPGNDDLAERMRAHRASEEIPPERLDECVAAFSSALRDIVRTRFGLPANEQVTFDIVTDKPWSGFNYYEGGFRSTVAINADLRQHTSSLPHLIAHEAYPGHHTEHCHKDIALVEQGQPEQTIFLVNTPQCLMAEGLADLALHAAAGEQWGTWAQEIYADLGLRFDGERAQRIAAAASGLLAVRQDAAIMLHDRHADADEVAEFLQRWLLITPQRARQTLRFLTSPLWRAYVSTYVEGYQLLRDWLRLDDTSTPVAGQPGSGGRFARLLDEPLLPGTLRADLGRARS
ncbi:DUF885 domain-containing protein [Lolliginicoccus suaedae]|uniref:DUF885 domain-containing protein n=1 Tax=Lolliginicoccus suaedae TaxID=2605429 RepID=UPI0011EC36CD|nr:DUF885 domain-containing protein [Lolliginicoccus suaedae]